MKPNIDKRYFHKGRKQIGVFDEECLILQAKLASPSSIFLKFDGEILEVSRIICEEIK